MPEFYTREQLDELLDLQSKAIAEMLARVPDEIALALPDECRESARRVAADHVRQLQHDLSGRG